MTTSMTSAPEIKASPSCIRISRRCRPPTTRRGYIRAAAIRRPVASGGIAGSDQLGHESLLILEARLLEPQELHAGPNLAQVFLNLVHPRPHLIRRDTAHRGGRLGIVGAGCLDARTRGVRGRSRRCRGRRGRRTTAARRRFEEPAPDGEAPDQRLHAGRRAADLGFERGEDLVLPSDSDWDSDSAIASAIDSASSASINWTSSGSRRDAAASGYAWPSHRTLGRPGKELRIGHFARLAPPAGATPVRRTRCAPSGRCRPGAGRASGSACSRRCGRCSGARCRRRACG